MKMLFIGAGNMAAALIGGLVARGTAPDDLIAVDPSPGTRDQLAERFGVVSFEQVDAAAVAEAGTIIMAVKPQQMREAAIALAPLLTDQLIVSIAAGIRIVDLVRWMNCHSRIVRAMPNTPALIGLGVTGLACAPDITSGDRLLAERIMAAAGRTVWVDDEAKLDAVTAISGSGPAYVFLFIEALEAAAVSTGLNAAQARVLVQSTVSGAAQLAERSTESPAELRARVTSKNGTTAAALEQLERGQLRTDMLQAVRAAYERSIELGDEFGRDETQQS